MPIRSRAVIYIQHSPASPPAERQLEVCLTYCESAGYELDAIIPGDLGDAAALVESGRVDVVITGHDSRAAHELAARIVGAGRVEAVHPEPRVIEPPRSGITKYGELIHRWFRRGRSVQQIAEDIDGDTTDVRAILRKYGVDPGRSR